MEYADNSVASVPINMTQKYDRSACENVNATVNDIDENEIDMRTILLLLLRGMQLFFILPLCACSQKAFRYYWKRYYMQPLTPNTFNLCVQWLLYNGQKLNLSYERINVLIFCVVWPLITIASIVLNIVLIIV